MDPYRCKTNNFMQHVAKLNHVLYASVQFQLRNQLIYYDTIVRNILEYELD